MPKFTKSVAAMALALVAVAGSAQAEYPEKPVEFVVPWPPGDLEDVLTRMIAEDFSEAYGVPTAVVNKPGGGGGPFPGAIEVANAPADGYTIGSFIIAIPVVGPQIGIPELNPDPFVPLGNFLTYPFVIAAGANAPYDDMAGLAAHAMENEVALGHFGAPLVPTQVTFGLAKEMGFAFASDAAFDALDCNTLASGDVDVINTVQFSCHGGYPTFPGNKLNGDDIKALAKGQLSGGVSVSGVPARSQPRHERIRPVFLEKKRANHQSHHLLMVL